MRRRPYLAMLVMAMGLFGCAEPIHDDTAAILTDRCDHVAAVPESVRRSYALDGFYQKHVDADGLPVISSSEPDSKALTLACRLVNNMLSQRDDIRRRLIQEKVRFVIIGRDEGTADIPEYGFRERSRQEKDSINQRARGLGGIAASCGEENILCQNQDRYHNESICVHEFSHSIAEGGLFLADTTFLDRLKEAYKSAMESGKLQDTYRKESFQEYWAEGMQDWYNTNDSAEPANGIHNSVDTRVELRGYDPALYALIDSAFPRRTEWGDCHVKGVH